MSGIDVTRLAGLLEHAAAPLLIDVRRRDVFLKDTRTLAGALRRDPDRLAEWAQQLPAARPVVVYCVHGHAVSQGVARTLNEDGHEAYFLEGGIADWRAHGLPLDSKPAGASTRWITRARPKIDRIACPWLITRFIDSEAEFMYVPTQQVRELASARDAVPYDMPDVYFSHAGPLCSFDAFLRHYRLKDPALTKLALIVRGADTSRLELAPQAAGLVAISAGLSRNFADDHEMLRHGMAIYDALHAWCRGDDELLTWKPAAATA